MYKLKDILFEQVNASRLAQQIYDAKGTFWDNERTAVATILQIKDAKQYNEVQKELQKLTGGRGIAQYVTSFIGHSEDYNPFGVGIPGTVVNKNVGQRTLPLLDKIIKHLTSISANAKSIQLFTTYRDKLSNKFLQNVRELPETIHTVNLILAISAEVLIPTVGPFIASGLAAYDAKLYWDEGEHETAIFLWLLAPIPGLAKLAKQVGAKQFFAKLLSRSGKMTALEQKLLTGIEMSKDAIQDGIRTSLQRGIQSGKLNPYAVQTTKNVLQKLGKLSKFVAVGAGTVVGAEHAADKIYQWSGQLKRDVQTADKEHGEELIDMFSYKNGDNVILVNRPSIPAYEFKNNQFVLMRDAKTNKQITYKNTSGKPVKYLKQRGEYTQVQDYFGSTFWIKNNQIDRKWS